MATLDIDGVGTVDIDDAFLRLTPEQQAKEVDAIAAAVRGGNPAAPEARTESGMVTDEELAVADVQAQNPQDSLKARGALLPLGTDQEGSTTLALPGFLEGPRRAIMDLLEGKRTAEQLSGKEIFELGGLFAGAGGASSRLGLTGAGKGAPAAGAAVPAVADDAARAATPEAPPVAAAGVPEVPPTAPVAAEPAVATATTPELKAAAKGFYKEAEDAGVILKPIRSVTQDIQQTLIREGLDPTLHPRATAALKRLDEVSDMPVSFQTLETLRRVANAAGKGADADELAKASIIKDKIDDFVANLSSKDVQAGDPEKAASFIVKARDLWSKVAKLEHVEGLVERARLSASNFSGSGMENALRTEFRTLAKNKKALRTFTPQEQKAIKKIAVGTLASNTARAAGKFAPTGVVSTVLSGATGGLLAGGVGAVAVPAGGFVARQIATKLAQRYVKQLEDTIRTGGDSELARGAVSRANEIIKLLSADASAAAGSTQN